MATDFLARLDRFAAGDPEARMSVLHSLNTPSQTALLVSFGVCEGGTEKERAVLDAHLADPKWSALIPLFLQEYKTVLTEGLGFDQPLKAVFQRSKWTETIIKDLEAPVKDSADAARRLREMLDAIAGEARKYVDTLHKMKPPLALPARNILHVDALMRTEAALGSLKGKKILEIGPDKAGVLMKDFEDAGANVIAIDFERTLIKDNVYKGDFMRAAIPGAPFDAIVSVGSLDPGAVRTGETDDRNRSFKLADRLRAKLAPRGVAVIENIDGPIPFPPSYAESLGFEILHQYVPYAAMKLDGRVCVLRLR
jgi:hypothetical protein